MPRQNYANLTVDAARSDKLRRSFEMTKITSRSFSAWLIDNGELSLEKVLYLKKIYPHFKFIENVDNMFLFEDTKANKIIKVEWKDGKPVSNEKNEDYIIYALLHPDFRLKFTSKA